MRLQLPGLEFSEGEVIEGELAVEARKGINTNEVRIQLLRKELGHGRRVRTSHTIRVKQLKLAGKARLKAGGSYAYPFKFEIPIQKCPSRSTPSATISYILQGVLNRRLRRDVCVDVPVTLYSSQRTE
jgi:hypothetical protein